MSWFCSKPVTKDTRKVSSNVRNIVPKNGYIRNKKNWPAPRPVPRPRHLPRPLFWREFSHKIGLSENLHKFSPPCRYMSMLKYNLVHKMQFGHDERCRFVTGFTVDSRYCLFLAKFSLSHKITCHEITCHKITCVTSLLTNQNQR